MTALLRRLRLSTRVVLAFLAVGLLLACIPGAQWVFACCGLLAWLVFICGLVWHGGRAVFLLLGGLLRPALLEALQMVVMVVGALLFLPLYEISEKADFVNRCLRLRAQAMALPDDGGPRLAWREGGEDSEAAGEHHGLAYDASGQIVRPRWLRSPAWQHRVQGTPLADRCLGARQIVGPFYQWDSEGCN